LSWLCFSAHVCVLSLTGCWRKLKQQREQDLLARVCNTSSRPVSIFQGHGAKSKSSVGEKETKSVTFSIAPSVKKEDASGK
jgi:hypothetical protein